MSAFASMLGRSMVRGLGTAAGTGLRQTARAGQLSGQMLRQTGQQVGQRAGQLATAAKPIVQQAAAKAPETARFIASVPKGQTLLGGNVRGAAPSILERTGRIARNVTKATVSPQYPGLDRMSNAPRVLDKTRSLAAKVGRKGSIAATGLLVPGVAAGIYNEVADLPAGVAGNTVKGLADYATNPNPDAATKILGETVRDSAIPVLRNDSAWSRQNFPLLMNATDALRSTTPLGLGLTAAMRQFSNVEPQENRMDVVRPHLQAATKRNSVPLAIDATVNRPRLDQSQLLQAVRTYLAKKKTRIARDVGANTGYKLAPTGKKVDGWYIGGVTGLTGAELASAKVPTVAKPSAAEHRDQLARSIASLSGYGQ